MAIENSGIKVMTGMGLFLACQVACADADMSTVAGYFESGSLTGIARNYYFNRDFRNGGANRRSTTTNGYRGEWAQGLTLDYVSAFTPGVVRVGFDAHVYGGLKLDSGRGKTGTNLLHVNNDGEVADNYSVGGAAVKVKFGETVLKYGDMEMRSSPAFTTDGGFGRLLPQTVTGWQVLSSDLKPLVFDAAHITAGKAPTETHNESTLRSLYGATVVDTVDYAGFTYQDATVKSSLTIQRSEDLWRQDYFGFRYLPKPVAGLSPSVNFNIYHSTDSGRASGGPIDNTSWSLAPGVKYGAHGFMLAFQKVNGDTPFDYLAFRDGQSTVPQLANNVQIHDFNAPNERSWQLRYDYDFAALGLPGLTLMTRYLRGSGGEASTLASNSAYTKFGYQDGARHWERDIDVQYVVQSGPAKLLSMKARYAVHRSNSAEPRGDMDEIRLIVEYPFKLL